ncbi:MAG TPA: response regulator transcription factor [Anaeromyxobacteraceae bacterium]|nr:response regulator transcription factor [Anaeromyxobacteraceae bacterium]
MRVLVADDHALFREGLEQILADHPDITVAAKASSGPEVLDLVARHEFDLLLLDIAMPGMSGLDVLKQVRSLKPRLRVLMLSMYPEEQYAVRAIKAGALGYLTKQSASGELIEAIRKVSAGLTYISSSIADRLLVDPQPDDGRPLHEKLSDREYQIFCLIARGRPVSRIAQDLSLSVKTVSTHRVHILEKMRMETNAELTSYALKHNLVNLTD